MCFFKRKKNIPTDFGVKKLVAIKAIAGAPVSSACLAFKEINETNNLVRD